MLATNLEVSQEWITEAAEGLKNAILVLECLEHVWLMCGSSVYVGDNGC